MRSFTIYFLKNVLKEVFSKDCLERGVFLVDKICRRGTFLSTTLTFAIKEILSNERKHQKHCKVLGWGR